MKHFAPIDILLPNDTVDHSKWAVIACDQHTSEGDYWQAVENTVQNAPSTLSMILPEYYLGKNDSERIEAINQAMREYLDSGIFKTLPNAYIYVERTLASGKLRRGIVGGLDLVVADGYRHARFGFGNADGDTAIIGALLSRIGGDKGNEGDEGGEGNAKDAEELDAAGFEGLS